MTNPYSPTSEPAAESGDGSISESRSLGDIARSTMNDENLREIHNNGVTLIRGAVDSATVDALMLACQRALEVDDQVERARSSRGHVYAARNLLGVVPEIQTFWQQGNLLDSLKWVLGDAIGLVRVLFFDKPPDRTWALPWHKDTAIGVKNAVAIHAAASDVLAMRPLITHSSGSSHPGTTRHRRILHLEFAACRELPDGYQWHDFVEPEKPRNASGDLIGTEE